eukprot:scaffold22653_cov119-Cylindrotheca_fusiformis.AAC.9
MMFSIRSLLSLAILLLPILGFPFRISRSTHLATQCSSKAQGDDHGEKLYHDARRSFLIASGLSTLFGQAEPASAAKWLGRKSGLYVIDDTSDAVRKEQVDTPVPTLSSEYALLKILPVKNPVFRTLEQNIESLSVVRLQADDANEKDTKEKFRKAGQSVETAIKVLTEKRSQLQPVFFTEDSTQVAIAKGERGEVLIESLLADLSALLEATKSLNATLVSAREKKALLSLSYLGELLVKEYPYRVPTTGKFSFLPRLLGRATVTFRIKRKNSILGNITIVADGYTAPITAGNFVDLCLRNFYTGLPVKSMSKKFGPTSDPIATNVNVLGSFNEGFYSPLTGKLRRIPLEVIRLEKLTGSPKLSYSFLRPDFTSLDVLSFGSSSFTQGVSAASLADNMEGVSLIPSMNSKPLLTFDTPGLVAMNHPDNYPNGGSSEFFALQDNAFPDGKNRLLDGQYAPFGFIIEGSSVFQSLNDGDMIDATFVDDFGKLNLMQIRSSSFTDVVQGTEAAALLF